MLEVIVDRDRCQGAAECVYLAPASFRLDATMRSVAMQPTADQDELLIEVACSCPNSAIRLFRDGVEVDAFAASEGSSNG